MYFLLFSSCCGIQEPAPLGASRDIYASPVGLQDCRTRTAEVAGGVKKKWGKKLCWSQHTCGEANILLINPLFSS